MKKIVPLLVMGTRPEAIKMAPVVGQCAQQADVFAPIICTTGQHREMLADVVDYFGIHADIEMDLMSPGQSLATLTARAIEGLDEVLVRARPDCVVAQGDTTTVMAASLAAFYRGIPFVHVEAGLRTGNLAAPWPEEFNRRVAGLTTSLHCAPTTVAAAALAAERVPARRIHVTGNTVIDALLGTVARERERASHWQERHADLGQRPMVLITGHRRENFGPGLGNLCEAIRQLATEFPGVAFVYPVHLNPQVDLPVRQALAGLVNVYLLPPAPYPEFVWLMDRSTVILTDSGGIQEEAPSLGKPVLVMRDSTERPEALIGDAVELVGTSYERIVARTRWLLRDPKERERRKLKVSPFGDGHAAQRIVNLMSRRAWDV